MRYLPALADRDSGWNSPAFRRVLASRGKAAGGAGIVSSSNIVGSESTGMSDLSDFVGRESTSSSTSIKQECLQDHIRCEASIIADGFTRSASSITEVTLIGSAFVAFRGTEGVRAKYQRPHIPNAVSPHSQG